MSGSRWPSVYTVDVEAGDKRSMPGTRAAWMLAHGKAPSGIVYRTCCNGLCVNWAHLSDSARTVGDVIKYHARKGRLRGTIPEQRRANGMRGLAKIGIKVTPPQDVMAIRLAPPEATNVELGLRFGLHRETVRNIRQYVRGNRA